MNGWKSERPKHMPQQQLLKSKIHMMTPYCWRCWRLFNSKKKSISSLYSTSLPQKRKWDLFSLLKEASLLFQAVLVIACCWSFGLFKPLWNHTHKILYSTLERSCLLLHHSNFLLGLPLLTDPYCSRSFVLYSNYSDVLVRLLFMMQQFLETLILKNGFDELNFSLHHPWE